MKENLKLYIKPEMIYLLFTNLPPLLLVAWMPEALAASVPDTPTEAAIAKLIIFVCWY